MPRMTSPDRLIISTHTSLAGRDRRSCRYAVRYRISTHTSLAGRDLHQRLYLAELIGFLLTRPSRDVTDPAKPLDILMPISTHTSLAGRDTQRRSG